MDLRLYHNSHEFYYRSSFGAVPSGSRLILRLRAGGSDARNCRARIRLWQSNVGESFVPMTYQDGIFTGCVTMPPKGCLVWYYFIVDDGHETVYYGNNYDRLGGEGAKYPEVPPAYQVTVYDKDAHTPDWFKHAIVYQIFPDRFRHGTHTTGRLYGKKGAVIHSDWDDVPYYCKREGQGDIVYYDFFGGNLAGIREKLPYLKELGITAIYLNPIFESSSNHRYGTADYFRVDPMLGTNEEFAAFCQAAKEAGIHIILDGVFSHTGADSIYFNRFGNYPGVGAYQSKESPYYEWYRFKQYPDDYESWWGVSDLPDVEETTPSYMDFIIDSEDSVLKYWLNEGISGWRLDVIDELPVPFLRQFYHTLKEEKPDAILIGEVWEDASNKVSYSEQREYLCGYDIDSAMNYAQRAIMLDFMTGVKDARRMNAELTRLIENYPPENFYAMLNLIGSHDIERILTVLTKAGGTDVATAEETGKKRLKLLTAWQMTMPGAPCIYYGDEVGVTGGKDPDNRRTYPWGHEDLDLLSWTKALMRLRTAHDALQTGRFIPLYADGDVFAFARVIEGGRDVFGKPAEDGFFIIAMNRNPSALRTISIYTDGLAYGKLTNALHPRMTPVTTVNSRLTLTLPPLKVVILQGKEAGTKRAGVLLHPTSLPAACGNGVLGPAAYRFVDFLKAAGQRVWQILPLTPPLMGDSPYLSESAFAGNEALISLEVLRDWGWLRQEALDDFLAQGQKTASWHSLAAYKAHILWDMSHDPDLTIPWEPFRAFCEKNAYWLDDYALFRAVRDFFGGRCWTEWPEDIRHHSREALAQYGRELAGAVSHVKFMQYIFSRQWHDVRAYAAKNGVSVLGDVPMFVAHNSADCWAHQDQFDLDEMGNPSSVAGVPPDYFSADGQLWGNPLYDYQAMAADNYQWWTDRFRRMMDLVDEVRVDHFRGFAAYWAVPAGSETAKSGAWKEGPGLDLFRAVYQKIGRLRLVAEDLGVITDDVCTLKDALHLPGMKVIQFHLKDRADGRLAFDTEPDCIAYTGTHDNNTIRGWYEDDLSPSQQLHVRQMLGLSDEAAPQEIVGALIAYTCRRRAETVIIPMQDLLALPSSGRMNTPGVAEGNWHWQLKDGQLTFDVARWLAKVCRESGR